MGVMTPKPVVLEELSAGEVGFFVATIKNVADTKVGDTITHVNRPCAEALPGFEDIKSMVFAGLYTVDSHEHGMLRDALEKLRLNDASFNFEPESSVALGFGFRCGFLGLLHLGNHPGTPGARIRSRPDHHCTWRAVQGHNDRRLRAHGRQSIALARPHRDRDGGRAGHHREDPYQRRICRWHPQARRRQARTPTEHRVRFRDARDADLRAAAERDRARLSTTN